MTQNIYFYLPKSTSIATSFQDFLARWQTYAEQLAKLSGEGSKIVMLTDSRLNQANYDNLQCLFIGKTRLRQFIWLYSRFIHDQSKKMLISGNNFDALLISLLIRRLSKKTLWRTPPRVCSFTRMG